MRGRSEAIILLLHRHFKRLEEDQRLKGLNLYDT